MPDSPRLQQVAIAFMLKTPGIISSQVPDSSKQSSEKEKTRIITWFASWIHHKSLPASAEVQGM